MEREGGHILVLVLVFLICMVVLIFNPEDSLAARAGDMALGALLLAMKGIGQPQKPLFDQPAVKSPSEIIATPVAPIVGG